jgi:hypothetical protein
VTVTANWAIQDRVTATVLTDATAVTDATPVASTDIDVRTVGSARLVLVLTAREDNANNTGGTWTIQESATDGGTYSACTLGGALVATPASAGTNVQKVTVSPNTSKPFVQAVFTGADAAAEVTITVTALAIPYGI